MQNENLPALFQGVAEKSPLEIRYAICRLEEAMRKACETGELQGTEFPLTHDFFDGKYTRTIFLPAGSLLVGKLHKHDHGYTIWSGKVTVVTEAGGIETIQGMYRGVSPAGVKRAIYVHEDTIWTVVHETDSTDLEEIESQVIAKSYTELGWEDPVVQLQLQQQGK